MHADLVKCHISYPYDICRDYLLLYRNACDHLYTTHQADLSRLVDIAGQSLLSGGRVVYCGSDTDGIIAMVDASECVPTYGSRKLPNNLKRVSFMQKITFDTALGLDMSELMSKQF